MHWSKECNSNGVESVSELREWWEDDALASGVTPLGLHTFR